MTSAPPRDPRSRTRRTDTLTGKLLAARAYRDAWLVLITGLVTLALFNIERAIDENREGRRIGLAATCAATDAIIDAGRAQITAGALGPGRELARFLEQHGYPPQDVREARALKAASAYARSITGRVDRATGLEDIVEPDGGLDCDRLEAAAASAGQ